MSTDKLGSWLTLVIWCVINDWLNSCTRIASYWRNVNQSHHWLTRSNPSTLLIVRYLRHWMKKLELESLMESNSSQPSRANIGRIQSYESVRLKSSWNGSRSTNCTLYHVQVTLGSLGWKLDTLVRFSASRLEMFMHQEIDTLKDHRQYHRQRSRVSSNQ